MSHQQPVRIDGVIEIERPDNNGNITITELGGDSIMVYKDTAIEVAHAILRMFNQE